MLSEILKIGGKVEIRVKQGAIRGNSASETMRVFASKLLDIVSDEEVVLAMPMESTKVILLPEDVGYEICFYTKKGLYSCTANVKERRKDNNVFTMVMRITSHLERIQRRKFYRLECLVDVNYYILTDSAEIEMETVLEAHEHHLRNYPGDEKQKGTIVDISGGGVRIISKSPIPPEASLILFFQVNLDDLECNFSTFGHVVKSNPVEKSPGRFEARIEYKKMSTNIRESIVKFIFKEERDKRQNQKK